MIKKDRLPSIAAAVLLLGTAGCAYEQPFSLPELTPAAPAASIQLYPYGGYGGSYYGAYGNGYRRGFYDGYYGYADPRYAGLGSYPYGHAYPGYPRYVVEQCPDANRDGRCDRTPPKHPGHGDDSDGEPQVQPPPSLDDEGHDDGPRRRHAYGSAPQVRPVAVAPVPQPSATRPPAARPPQATAGSTTQPAPARVRQRSGDAEERPARRPPPPPPRSSDDERRTAPP